MRDYVSLNWPELTVIDRQISASSSRSGFGGRPDVIALGVREVWGEHRPTTDDWLMYCILQHPVMQHYVEQNKPTADGAEAATEADSPEEPKL